MRRKAIPLVQLSLAAILVNVASAEDYDVAELERDFASAELRIVHRVANIPFDIRDKLFSVAGEGIADFGEGWNSTDVLYPGVPTAQHLFTGEADAVAAVAFRSGGYTGARLQLLLTRRHANWYCLYSVPIKERIADSMGFIQHLFPPQEGSKLRCRRVDDASE